MIITDNETHLEPPVTRVNDCKNATGDSSVSEADRVKYRVCVVWGCGLGPTNRTLPCRAVTCRLALPAEENCWSQRGHPKLCCCCWSPSALCEYAASEYTTPLHTFIWCQDTSSCNIFSNAGRSL